MQDRETYILTDSPIKRDLLKLFEKDQKLIIMDIGACEGEESIRYSKIFPNSSIYCFEPLPKNQKDILLNIKKHNLLNVELIPVALSDEEGEQKLYVSSGQPEEKSLDNDWDYGNKSSSLYPPNKHLKELLPWLKFDEEIIVNTQKLCNFLKYKNILVIDFIHMDVQGAELKVLTGAESNIKNIKAIWLEVSDVILYNNQPTRSDIENFMKKNGFYLVKSRMEGQVGDQMYLNSIFFKTVSFFSLQKHFKLKANKVSNYGRISYSQCGEDIIMSFIFHSVGIVNPTYLDIGAHHPFYLSNTALFYEAGSTGINIEPDPTLIKEFYLHRKRDININKGISDSNSSLDFYIMSSSTLNTFSKEEAYRYEKLNYKILEIKKIEVVTIDVILKEYINNKIPELLTIDAEGVDEIILRSIDFSTNFPIVICVETISFSNVGKGVKNVHLIEFIKSKGYLLYADTYINSIFVKENVWIRG